MVNFDGHEKSVASLEIDRMEANEDERVGFPTRMKSTTRKSTAVGSFSTW